MKSDRRRVCMIAYTAYAADARVRREAETLAAQGFDVLCLTNRNGAERKHFILEGVEVQELDVPKYRGKSTAAYLLSYLRFLAAASIACVRLSRSAKPAVVHVHNLPDFLVFAAILPRLRGAKIVLDVHDSVPETFATKFSQNIILEKALRLEERASAWFAHRVICVNHPQKDALTARGIPLGKTFVSMNVPDPRIFDQIRPARRASAASAFRLVYHGTMAERLGVDLLIRSVARLQDRIPDLQLHLWGNGDDLGAFQALATTLGVEGRVFFKPGGVPLRDLPLALADMDLCVVGNRRSPAGELMLPVKLLECVALGIPAVVPRLRTIQHYFSDEMVTYYEPGDVESLAHAIHRLFSDPSRLGAQAACAREFLSDYGWHRQGAELVRFYQQLVSD